jgi:hypothetical protein
MKSLELNWIRNVDRTIPMPEVMYFPFTDAAGRYYNPELGKEIYDADGKPFSLKYGVIAVSSKFPELIEETIAHEWRHHWQFFNGFKFDVSPINLFKKFSYEEALIRYFATSKTEMDALRFQYQYSTVHDFWEEILFGFIQDLHVKPIITYGRQK